MATERLVVVGGDAAGMSAASQARRLKGPAELEIVAFERGHFTSYSACGIPYWIGGQVPGRDELIARTPEEHRARDIDLRMRTEVGELDVAGGGSVPAIWNPDPNPGRDTTSSSWPRGPARSGPGCPGSARTGCTASRPWTTASA